MKQAATFALLAACFMMVSCLAYSWTLKMEGICPSETSVDFHRTRWRHIPEDRLFFTRRTFRHLKEPLTVSHTYNFVLKLVFTLSTRCRTLLYNCEAKRLLYPPIDGLVIAIQEFIISPSMRRMRYLAEEFMITVQSVISQYIFFKHVLEWEHSFYNPFGVIAEEVIQWKQQETHRETIKFSALPAQKQEKLLKNLSWKCASLLSTFHTKSFKQKPWCTTSLSCECQN
jgi:hypothetical protein